MKLKTPPLCIHLPHQPILAPQAVDFVCRLQRAPQSLNLHTRLINHTLPGDILMSRQACDTTHFVDFPLYNYALTSSELWKPLTAAYGKCDGMVTGKYHKARMFSFETQSLYLWCVTETGDRGSMWQFLDKTHFDPNNRTKINGFCMKSIDHTHPNVVEIENFICDLLLDMIQSHAPTMKMIKNDLQGFQWAPLLRLEAIQEANILCNTVNTATPSPRRPSI